MSVQAGDNSGNDMLEWSKQIVAVSLTEHQTNAETDIFIVTSDVRITAHEHYITPAKYLAICELQAVDTTATFEGCAGHSISEIRERIQSHGSDHHNEEHDSQNADTEHEQPIIDEHEPEETHDIFDGNGIEEHPHENGGNHHGENNGNQNAGIEHEQEVDMNEVEETHDESDNNEHAPSPSNGNNDTHHESGNGH
jgi:hypothetical protein